MPLVVPQLPKIENLRTLLGKRVLDESLIPDTNASDQSLDNVIFKAQLPTNVVLIKESVDKVSITGALKSGYIPVIVTDDDVVVQVY